MEEEVVVVRKKHTLLNVVIILSLIFIFLFVYAKYIGTCGLVVKEYKVESKILTKNYSGIKIVHFSDLIYNSTYFENDLINLVERINELKPDIVVFTGDLFNTKVKLTSEDKKLLIDNLSKITYTIGSYAVYGDNDYSLKEYDSIMQESGFKILDNSYEEIFNKSNDSIYIVGLPSISKENIDYSKAFSFYNEENRKYIIVLSHDGKTISSLNKTEYEVDLILGGHSLNGLINIPFYGGVVKDKNTDKYVNEYYSKGITNIYISGGLGTHDYGYRFMNKPSFNLYRLKAL